MKHVDVLFMEKRVKFIPKESQGPNGYIDLMVGVKGDDADNADFFINDKMEAVTNIISC